MQLVLDGLGYPRCGRCSTQPPLFNYIPPTETRQKTQLLPCSTYYVIEAASLVDKSLRSQVGHQALSAQATSCHRFLSGCRVLRPSLARSQPGDIRPRGHRPMRKFLTPTIPWRIATHRGPATRAANLHTAIISHAKAVAAKMFFVAPAFGLGAFGVQRDPRPVRGLAVPIPVTQADVLFNLWQTDCLHGKVFPLQCVSAASRPPANPERMATYL
jgi:hypothetical protein